MAISTETSAQGGRIGGEEVKNVKPLEGDELLQAIKNQVEYYFSRENLLQDSYLISKMDKDHSVEIAVIADFKLVKALTSDEDLIITALKNSTKIVVDDANKKVKPVVVNARTTLIMRNVTSSAPEADVRKFLADAKIPTIVSIRSDVGDNWFVSFETEEAAKSALDIVKTLKWESKTVGGAIKSESLLKGITPGSPPKTMGLNSSAGYFVPMQYSNVPQYNNYNNYQDNQGGFRNNRNGHHGRRPPAGGPGTVNSNGVPLGADGADGSNKKGSKKGGKGRQGREGVREGGQTLADNERAQQAPINMADFPVLETRKKSVSPPGSVKASSNSDAEDNGNAQTFNEPRLADGPASSDASTASTESNNEPPARPVAAPSPSKKLSYAQMALAAKASE